MNLATRKAIVVAVTMVAVLALGSVNALAQGSCTSILVWNAITWEEDPPGTTAPTLGLDGNLWLAVGNVNAINAPLTSDFAANEYTIHIVAVRNGDQMLTGSGTDFFGNDYDDYQSLFDDNGTLSVYEDAAKNATFTAFPPNVNVPSTFTDGSLYLAGLVSALNLQVRVFTSGFKAGEEEGSFSAVVNWTGGSNLGELAGQTEGSSFGGVARNSFIGIPGGFQHDLAGESFRCPVAVEESTWGQIKNHYAAP